MTIPTLLSEAERERAERMARVLRHVPTVERNPRGANAMAIQRRTKGLSLQHVLAALERLVKHGDVTKLRRRGDAPTHYVIERKAIGHIDPSGVDDPAVYAALAAHAPIDLYRHEKAKRRARYASQGRVVPGEASVDAIDHARRLFDADRERRHGGQR